MNNIISFLTIAGIAVFTLMHPIALIAQEKEWSTDDLLDDSLSNSKVTGAFKSTRVIQAHSIEMIAPHNLDFRILHRFGTVDQGFKQFFGLDQARTRIGFDYGMGKNLAVGIGRSSYRKELDGFAKIRLLHQSEGAKSMPVSVIAVLGTTAITEEVVNLPGLKTIDRLSYYAQLLIGRKFSNSLSLQLSPILLHQNFVFTSGGKNTIAALGIGGRVKLSKRIALTGDYHYVAGGHPNGFYDPIAVGIDIETGGHVFQLHFTNSVGMSERAFLVETADRFFKGEVRFGFNLSRMFALGKK